MSAARIVHLSTVHRTQDNRIYNKECAALAESGFDVHLVIRSDREVAPPFPVHPLPTPTSRLRRLTVSQARAWWELSRLRPAVVHIHDPELVPMTWLWSRLHRALLVVDAHEDLTKQIATKPYLRPWQRAFVRSYARLLTVWADRGADGIVAATGSIAKGFRNPRTVVVHNYPWLRDFEAQADPVPGRLVYAGDLTQERKFSFMVQVANRLRQLNPEAHLVLAGKLVGLSPQAESQIDGDVVRHVGLLPPREVPAFISTGMVGLIFLEPLPNYTTSLPTKLFEYMAAGIPFAASDFPFWRQNFERHDAGIFVDSDDVEAAVSGLHALLADPVHTSEMGSNGRRAVESGFTFESQVPALVGLMESLGVAPIAECRPVAMEQ